MIGEILEFTQKYPIGALSILIAIGATMTGSWRNMWRAGRKMARTAFGLPFSEDDIKVAKETKEGLKIIGKFISTPSRSSCWFWHWWF